MPIADCLQANGSWVPVGFWPIPNIPTKVSSFSASATDTATSVLGSSAPEYFGQYCCSKALATSSDSPSALAYYLPIAPWGSVNPNTISYIKSDFANNPAL